MKHIEYVIMEAQQIEARFKALEEKNRSIASTQIRMYSLLLLYAAAPFSAPNVFDTAFLRVWGFGGFLLAGMVWMHIDRGYRAYGRHLFERIYCLRHLAALRKVIYADETEYLKNSLLISTSEDLNRVGCGDPTHVSSSQATVTTYFYKLISLFPPLYIVLFLALIIAPTQMLDPDVTFTRVLYFRFILGFSVVIFLWGLSSTRNCLAFQEQAYLARRISVNCPWPLFPEIKTFLPAYAAVRRIVRWTLSSIAIIVALTNMARLGYILFDPCFTDGWQDRDFDLLWVTLGVFGTWVLFVECDARYVLQAARDKWKSPRNWLDEDLQVPN